MLSAIGFLWILACCSGTVSASTVQGRVVDVNGVGVPGVKIEILQVGGELPPWILFTGQDGRYQIGDKLIFGNLDVTASKGALVLVPRVKSVLDPGNSIVTADFTIFDQSPVKTLDVQFDRLGIVLNGIVNGIGLATAAFFEYGTESGLDQRTEAVPIAGETDQSVSTRLTGFVDTVQGGRFLVRIVATNRLGRSEGSIREVPLPTFLPRFTARATDALAGPNVMVGDVNGAGSMDFFLFDQDSSDGRPQWRSSELYSWSPQLFCLGCDVDFFIQGQVMAGAWTDVNQDNRPDVLITTTAIGRVLQNTEAGLVPTVRFSVGFRNGYTMRTLDLNADGLMDGVMSGLEINIYCWWPGGRLGCQRRRSCGIRKWRRTRRPRLRTD